MRVIFLIALVVVFSGCSTSGKNEYINMERKILSNNNNTLNLDSSVIIQTGKLEKIDLVTDDLLHKFNGYISYYKVLKLKADTPGKYKVDLWSICDCVAPKKIINPIFELYDASGKVVTSKIIETKVEDVNWEIKRPLSIHNLYEFEYVQAQDLFIVLAANNESIGKPLTTIKTNAYAPGVVIPMSISVITHPIGTFELQISKGN